MNQLGNNEVIS